MKMVHFWPLKMSHFAGCVAEGAERPERSDRSGPGRMCSGLIQGTGAAMVCACRLLAGERADGLLAASPRFRR